MIFWRGKGIWAAVVPFLLTIFLQLILGDEAIYAGIGYSIGGVLVWIFGRRWNKAIEDYQEYSFKVNPSNFQKIHKHSLFWIDMEYWSIFFVVMGLSILISELLIPMSLDTLLTIWGIGILSIVGIQLLRNTPKVSELKSRMDAVKEVVGSKPSLKKTNSSKLNKETSASKITTKPKSSLSTSNKFIQELKKNRETPEDFKASDPNRYMPK